MMDLFAYWPECKVLICRKCKFAVPPGALKSHLHRVHQEDHVDLNVRVGPAAVANKLLTQPNMPLIDPRKEKLAIPEHKIDASPFLDLHPGYQCSLCPKVLRSKKSIARHLRTEHGIVRRGPGRPDPTSLISYQDWTTVTCQRLFGSRDQSFYFAVYSPAETKARKMLEDKVDVEEDSVPNDKKSNSREAARAELFGRLAIHSGQSRANNSIVAEEVDKTEASPWLDLTRWTTYLAGHSLSDVARLGAMPVAGAEPLLGVFGESIDRLVELAHRSVCQDRINAFDQMRNNSLLQRPRAADRPLMVNLQKSTYKRYSSIWKRLLCFVHRTVQSTQTLQLQHRLTPAQILHYDRLMVISEGLLRKTSELDNTGPATIAELSTLDRHCLRFCASLLDHELKASLFESSILGFLAMLGIDEPKGILKDAYQYTPMLSGFIKISQLLVIQYAIDGAEAGVVSDPADLLDELRDRFMIHGTRSTFNWASRLRMYGKKVRDSTTCLGYIEWTDDGQYVTYKDIDIFGMEQFKDFVRAQVQEAQVQLEELILLHPNEKREDMGIAFRMHRLVDNAAENVHGWNFL